MDNSTTGDMLQKLKEMVKEPSEEQQLLKTLAVIVQQHRAGEAGTLPAKQDPMDQSGWSQVGRGRGSGSFTTGKGGRGWNLGKGAYMPGPYANPTCFQCGKLGHYANMCPLRADFQPPLPHQSNPQPNTTPALVQVKEEPSTAKLDAVQSSIKEMCGAITALTQGLAEANSGMQGSFKESLQETLLEGLGQIAGQLNGQLKQNTQQLSAILNNAFNNQATHVPPTSAKSAPAPRAGKRLSFAEASSSYVTEDVESQESVEEISQEDALRGEIATLRQQLAQKAQAEEPKALGKRVSKAPKKA